MGQKSGLYVHIPFCRRRCGYCDFVSSVYDEEKARAYVDALLKEAKRCDGRRFATAYIGGGTPTVLENKLLEKLLAGLPLAGAEEITAEANPESLTREKAQVFKKFGVNRMSLGVQSFDDRLLGTLGRLHSGARAAEAFKILRGAGFENLSIDLIFGIPGETEAMLEEDIRKALALKPEHISYYCLTIEEGTAMKAALDAGRLTKCSEETELAMFRKAIASLKAAGYAHYEISNFARPGFECRHNVNYWKNGGYAGLGAGAASHEDGVRSGNEKDIDRYIERITAEGSATEWSEKLDGEKKLRETLIMGLRMMDGVEAGPFAQVGEIEPLLKKKLLAARGGRLRLTEKGLAVADTVMEALV